jgi:glycosyltransferase involved in cell wall biosynthesis
VHTTSLKADLFGLAAARLASVPVVWHVHDRIADDYLPHRVVKAFQLAARHGPSAVIANSSATAVTLPGVPRLTVVYPGLAPEQVLDKPLLRKPPTETVVGLIGRISPTKGQLEFVRAAARVTRHRPDVRFRIVGSAMFGEHDYEAEVLAEIQRLGMESRISLTGFREDVGNVLDGLTLCVHASPVPEPFGQVVVEAMARRVPVVATSAGAIPEILQEGRLGYLVRPGSPEDLAEGILRALEDPYRSSTVDAAWVQATTRFTTANTAEGVLALWRQTVGGAV